MPTAVLVHGAGHDSTVWDGVRAALSHPSVAVDLPGRRSRPADITRVTVADAAAAVAAGAPEGDVVLVGHSVAGTVLPSAAALLGDRVRHLVFVAGITAPDGVAPVDVFLPGESARVAERLRELRAEHGGRTLEEVGTKVGSAIDSLNLSAQPMAWAGVPASVPRTFVRCLRDPIQPRELQAAFAESCGAGQVLDIDSGHTPALDAPTQLAALLDGVASAHAGGAERG